MMQRTLRDLGHLRCGEIVPAVSMDNDPALPAIEFSCHFAAVWDVGA